MKFVKKPIIIEAMQYTFENCKDVEKWCSGEILGDTLRLRIGTLEGVLSAHFSDWIIKGIKGEFYPCKDDIFRATYDIVKESVVN